MREDRIKEQESVPAVPLVTRDGTRITSENKENQDTWEYFINNVYNKTSQYNDTLGTPVYTLYLAWLEETYGQNKLERLWAWLDQAISQIVLGNYEENSTVTGTVGQVLMGLANLDLPGDIRDLSYDLIHWDTTKEHILQTVMDAAGLLPVIGAVKYGDEASSALKHADEVVQTVDNLKPQNLMDELANNGVKYSPNDVVMVTKTPSGKLMWLENGNDSAGLNHIVNGHAEDFINRGINDIPSFLNKTLQEVPVATGINKAGPYADYLIDGKKYRVGYGTNGYIVSFYPIN